MKLIKTQAIANDSMAEIKRPQTHPRPDFSASASKKY